MPGCGRGVDVLLLASFGYDAYGLECSATAVDACKKEEKENHSPYRVRDEKVGKGKIIFVQGDFFDDTWLKGGRGKRKEVERAGLVFYIRAIEGELTPYMTVY